MCGILGGSKMQESKRFAFPSYPFDAKALTDWAMDEYHYAADPKLIYKIAEQGGPSLDWMAECGVQWRLGEVPVYVAPKNATLDHHVLKMKDATDAMFNYGQRKGVDYHFQSPAVALVQDETGRVVGVVCKEDYQREVFVHATAGHLDGGRLLQQQGASRPLHSYGCNGLRVELPHARRDRRVLSHGPWRGR